MSTIYYCYRDEITDVKIPRKKTIHKVIAGNLDSAIKLSDEIMLEKLTAALEEHKDTFIKIKSDLIYQVKESMFQSATHSVKIYLENNKYLQFIFYDIKRRLKIDELITSTIAFGGKSPIFNGHIFLNKHFINRENSSIMGYDPFNKELDVLSYYYQMQFNIDVEKHFSDMPEPTRVDNETVRSIKNVLRLFEKQKTKLYKEIDRYNSYIKDLERGIRKLTPEEQLFLELSDEEETEEN